MNIANYAKELHVAVSAANQAALKVMELYAHIDPNLEAKYNAVTEADKAAESIIIEILQYHFPGDAFCSEEKNASWPESAKRVWIIDPLDGTRGYCFKNGEFCVQLALYDAPHLACSVVFEPTKQRVLMAVKGQGAYLLKQAPQPINLQQQIDLLQNSDVEKLEIATPTQLTSAILTISKNSPDVYENKLDDMLNPSRIDKTFSMGVKMASVSCGEAHIYATEPHNYRVWDWAPGKLIVEQAGGIVVDYHGNEFPVNKLIHDKGLWATSATLLQEIKKNLP